MGALLRAAALCWLALEPAAVAQQADWSGVEAPAESFSLQDDGTSLGGNPGGLAFASGLEADFLHNGFYVPAACTLGSCLSETNGHTEALFLTAGIGPLSLGVGFDWLHRERSFTSRLTGVTTPATFSARRTSLGAALRFAWVGLGAVHRGYASGSNSLIDGVSTWDFGLLARPASWLSVGAASLDATEPSIDAAGAGAVLPRRWRFSVGARPIGERAELAADLHWSECSRVFVAPGPTCGFDHKALLFTLNARLGPGLRLLAQLGLPDVGNGAPTTGLVGVQIDLPHLGVAYAPRFAADRTAQTEYRVRLSSERWPALRLPVPRAALIDLHKALERPKPGVLGLVFGQSSRDPLAETLAAFRRLAADSTVKAVVLRASDLPIGMGKAEELRAGIEEMQSKGKKVVFYLESAGSLEYSLASSADRIFAAPQAILTVNGLSATALFAATGLDKLGVKAEFFRVGAYKNAPDIFTRSEMSSEQREVQNALLDDLFGRYLARIEEKRHLEGGKLKALLDKGILKPQEARDGGLLDGLVYPDQLEEEAGKLLGGRVFLEKTSIDPPVVREQRWGPKARIAVVRVEGNILRGEGRRDPFGAVKIAGSTPIARRIREAADDPRVAAIVVRIDSPGGDGNASDLIWRELQRARKEKKKPVIASMGDVAASGGYYVAAGADEIFAEPSTITGSIGVFVGRFDAEELYRKLGLNLVTVKRGESADLFATNRATTDAERKTLQGWVENFYDQFVERVAEARHMSKAEVDRVARGRVWTGAQAMERKLIDGFGGLPDAVAAAKKRAGIAADEPIDLDDETWLPVELQDLAGANALADLPFAGRALRALQLLGEPGTLRAILPYDLEVH